MRAIVVGGGIVGLATARELARRGTDVILLERERELARHQTSHNSGVAHAGIYYAPGSLKARLCRRGIGLLRAFCAEHDLGYEACGKLVVALEEDEVAPLERLHERATENGVPGLRWLSGAEIREVEPHAAGVAALHSPETAIVDFAAVAQALAAELTAAGGEIRTETEVLRVERGRVRAKVVPRGGAPVEADRVVVCSGLQSDRLAQASGQPAAPRIVPFRGEYWQLRPEHTALVRGLIYPVPDPSLPFLGVHLTRTIDGRVLIGPNAVLSLARYGYERRALDLCDVAATLSWPGTPRMMRRHWRAGVAEMRRSLSRSVFIRDAQRYVPELRADHVMRAPAGIRAQAIDRDGSLVDDFRLAVEGGVAWVRNAPSPAATSSLAIAEELADRIAPPV